MTASSPPSESGFAQAVSPVAGTAITTDTQGLATGHVRAGAVEVYFARPESPTGRLATVVVLHEIFGLHEHVRDVARRLAKAGYLAVAPELFARHGNAQAALTIEDARAIAGKVSDADVLSDIDATLAWAVTDGEGDSTRVAVTGFCWGGRVTWLYAAHAPSKVKAGVAWYGRLVGENSDRQPKFPIDVAPWLTVPVLGLYGGEDKGIPVQTVQSTREALQTGASGSEIVLFDQAPHAFFADYRPSYRPIEAKQAWEKFLQWLQSHGVATNT